MIYDLKCHTPDLDRPVTALRHFFDSCDLIVVVEEHTHHRNVGKQRRIDWLLLW